MVRHLALLALAGTVWGQTSFYPVQDLRPGQRGVGRTVFAGNRIEEFGVEILGVLENAGPKQSIVLARLSGGPLDSTGVLQGMSGSPVWIDGKLVGAVALAFSFSKEPIAGIRPIGEMVRPAPVARANRAQAPRSLAVRDLTAWLPPRDETGFGESRMIDIATPVSFGGFTRGTLEQFGPQLRALGLEPRQGISAGASNTERYGNPADLKPGSMISVQLLAGDLSMGADGTVTHIDAGRVYAFGHRFLSVGETELPFARSEVLALLPNLSTSFKISAAREWLGSITEDRSTAVAGELGRRAALIPVSIDVAGGGKQSGYKMRMVNNRFLSPFLLQMAIYSAIDATERTLGTGSFTLRGKIEFEDGTPALELNNMFAGDFNVPLQVALAPAAPLAYALQSGFETLKLKNVSVQIESFDDRRLLQIDQAWLSRRQARPGEEAELTVVLAGDNGREVVRKASYTVPRGAPPGQIYFTVADGMSTNMAEYRHLFAVPGGAPPRSAAQVVRLLNSLRGNTKAYVRVWRADPSYQVSGQDLANLPASLGLLMGRSAATPGGALPGAGSKLAELEIAGAGAVIAGSRTLQLEVKE